MLELIVSPIRVDDRRYHDYDDDEHDYDDDENRPVPKSMQSTLGVIARLIGPHP